METDASLYMWTNLKLASLKHSKASAIGVASKDIRKASAERRKQVNHERSSKPTKQKNRTYRIRSKNH